MKTLRTLFVIAIALFISGFSTQIKAQSSKTTQGTANAKVLTPLVLTAANTLEFGSFATTGTIGTVLVPMEGAAVFSNVTEGSISSPRPATFTVTGQKDCTYAITLPANDVVVLTKTGVGAGAPTMKVKDFLSNTASVGDGLFGKLGDVADVITIGATLEVAASQSEGDYTGTYNVIVDYN